jgi:beta-phosphoglucomutase-like phosphatase (HAD superfamily)
MGAFYLADRKTCEEVGMTMTKKQFYDLAGVPIREIFRILSEEQGTSPDLDAMAARCKTLADEIMRHGPALIEPVAQIARDAAAAGIPIAVASSGVRPTVRAHLEGHGVLGASYTPVPVRPRRRDARRSLRIFISGASLRQASGFNSRPGRLSTIPLTPLNATPTFARMGRPSGLFAHVVTCEDVEHGKPAPDLYLLAAKKLGVDPTRCVAYEDAELGMESARRAGMVVVDVRKLDGYPCDDYLDVEE